MMERSPTMAGIFLFSSILLVHTCNGDFPSGAIQAIRCMLLQTAPEDCSSERGVPVPSYLAVVYSELPSTLHEALHSNELKKLQNRDIAALPLSILYLIPRARLADLTGAQLGAILQQHADDTSLAQQLSSSLQNTEHLQQILHKLKVTSLSQDVQRVLGERIHISDLTEESLSSLPHLEEPILAYIRPSVLFKTDTANVHRVMLHMREINNKRLPKKEAVYVLAEAAIRHQYLLNKIQWLVEGLTADEIMNESLLSTLSPDSFKLDLSSLQARAVFERVYSNMSLHRIHFIDSKPLLSRLSPQLLQKFPVREQKYDATLPQTPLSLPTAIQIREYVKADCQLTGKLPKDAEEWSSRLRYLGPWVFTLPLSRLEEYLENPLNEAILQVVQSPKLSPLQAYYLTGRGTALDLSDLSSVVEPCMFLQAVPASQLTSRKIGQINSVLLVYLVKNLPGDNLPRTLSLVHKIASSIGDQETLVALLNNKDVNSIMSLVSPKDLQTSAPRMLRVFASNEREFGPIVRRLPQAVLFTFLEEAQKDLKWNWNLLLDQTQIYRSLIGGLSCQHVEEIDTGLFIPVLAEYNRHRDQSFPKNLQHCCLLKLISHLELKMALSRAEESKGLMSILEPIEIEAVGGYVLAGLPVEAMKQSPYLGNLVSTIGKLSNAELMLAENLTHLQNIAKLAVKKDGSVDAFHAGNLNWFLPPDSNVSELRLVLEAGLLDTTLCVPGESRRLIAARLLLAFGPPESWSASVLSALQDLLIVFNDDELRAVEQDSWTEAADSLISHYGDNVEWIKPAPFYQVCMNRLGKFEEMDFKAAVALYAGYLLRAAQWQLDTVNYQSQPDKQYENMIPVKHETLEPGITVRVFQPNVVDVSEDGLEIIDYKETSDEEEDEEEGEGDGEGEEEYEEEEEVDNQDREEHLEVTTKKTQTVPSSTESSNIKIQDIFIDTHIKPIITTDKITTPMTTTTVKQIPLSSSESSVIFDVTPLDKIIHGNGFSTESSHILNNISSVEDRGNMNKNQSKMSPTEDLTTKPNNTESDSRIDQKIDSEPNLNENELPKKENTTVKLNSTEIESTSASPNVTLTSTPSYTNHINYSQEENVIKGTNTSKTENKTESSTTTTVLSFNALNTTSNITIHAPDQVNTSVFETKKSPNISHKVVKDSKKNKTMNTEYVENETIDKTSVMNISIPEAPVHTKESYEVLDGSSEDVKVNTGNNEGYDEGVDEDNNEVLNEGEDEGNDEGDDEVVDEDDDRDEDESDGAEGYNKTSILVSDPDSSMQDNTRRKRNDRYLGHRNELELSCNALRMVGRIAGLALTDVESMSDEELNDCRWDLGTMELTPRVLKYIWRRINKQDGVHLFGNLLKAAAVGDIWDLEWDISRPWTLENIQAFVTHSNNSVVLEKLIASVKKENADFSPELLAVLGDFICSLEADSMRFLSVVGLQPPEVGHCPPCLPQLAQRAVDQLGPVAFWTQHHTQVLQHVVAGLPLSDWKTLIESPFKPLYGLQPSAVRCLSESHLQALTLTEIKQIPTLTLLALPPEVSAPMNVTQVWSLGNKSLLAIPDKQNPILDIFSVKSPSGSTNLVVTVYLTVITNVFLLVRNVF